MGMVIMSWILWRLQQEERLRNYSVRNLWSSSCVPSFTWVLAPLSGLAPCGTPDLRWLPIAGAGAPPPLDVLMPPLGVYLYIGSCTLSMSKRVRLPHHGGPCPLGPLPRPPRGLCWQGHMRPVNAMRCTGHRIVSVSDDHTIRVWALEGLPSPSIPYPHSGWI